MNPDIPQIGFENSEFFHRTERAQRLMKKVGLDALLLTTEPEVRYFSGFQTAFWLSPTRPWFLIVPREGKPIAVIPEIGGTRMGETWLDDIVMWPAPRPNDEGITELTATIKRLKKESGVIGVPMGTESHIRMPFSDFKKLQENIRDIQLIDASPLIQELRKIKSEAEISKIRHICQLVSKGFLGLHKITSLGDTEKEIFRKFRIDLLARGADEVPYLVGGSGPNGPKEVIGMPSNRTLTQGDMLMMDTGAVFDGYFSDFDRNFCFGSVDESVAEAYAIVYRATDAGLKAARPGITAEGLWKAMADVLSEYTSSKNAVGRLGHGLGMQLTEWPSNMKGDNTLMQPGMVMTLEPCIEFADGRIMVHEENIVIRDGEPEMLSIRAPSEIPLIY